jgi:hypothetical protein
MLDILIVVLTAAIVWDLLTNNDDGDDDGGSIKTIMCTKISSNTCKASEENKSVKRRFAEGYGFLFFPKSLDPLEAVSR